DGDIMQAEVSMLDLVGAMEDLKAMMNSVLREIELQEGKGKQRTQKVQAWLDKVVDMDQRTNQLMIDFSRCCVTGCCSLNIYSRLNASRKATKLKKEIDELMKEKIHLSVLGKRRLSNPIIDMPISTTNVGIMIGSNLRVIRDCLADKRFGIIGIYGMGGVGKSTLLQEIERSIDGWDMAFDYIIHARASYELHAEDLHECIAEQLLLCEPRREAIFKFLKYKNFLLLLDDLWEELDITVLGIPDPHDEMTFTTRSEGVCAKMGAGEHTIKVECLEPDESWDLFKDNVNLAVIESDEKFKEIAWQVMEKCCGLPLALKVVGKAMSNKKSVQEWKFILNSIKNSGTSKVQGVEESLFPILKFSYDNLTNDFKECFLSFCMLRGRSKYEIVWFWMGFGLISDFDNSQEAYDKGENILKTLEESCLLSSDDVWIASDCGINMNKWIVKQYDRFADEDEIPSINAKNWRFANRVIISGNVELLPILSHQCSDLLCLMIQFNSCFKNIPEGFFRWMPNLTYLNLEGTCIEKLPKDIKCFVNLQYLDISWTRISSLPKENLKGLGKVKDGLMSKLRRLKVIDIFPTGWVDLEELKELKKHVKVIGMRVVSKEVLQQLSCLPTALLCLYKLDIISLSFDTLSCKNHGYLHTLQIESSPQLEQIVMNGRKTHLRCLEIFNVEKLKNIIWTDLSPPEYFHVLKQLYISNCNLDNLAWVLHLPCLSYLYIEDCAGIETLFYINEREIQQQEVSEHRPTFPALQSLVISDLPKLVSISNFALYFPRLSYFSVCECLNLKKLSFKSGINNNNQRTTLIKCEREWWESLEWDDASIPSHLRLNFSKVIKFHAFLLLFPTSSHVPWIQEC
ncbi:P-loop containing nucleoside triphosphate hydrolase protein, partial [Dioscorea alata]